MRNIDQIRAVNMRIDSHCPGCKQPVTVEHKPAKWEGETDKVIIEHKKWQEGYK